MARENDYRADQNWLFFSIERACLVSYAVHATVHVIIALGIFVFVLWLAARHGNLNEITFIISGVIASLVVAVVSRIFTYYFPAECKKCGGKSYCVGLHPVRFICKNCSHEHVMALEIGAGD
jgi:hypothetical protein